MTEPKAPAKKKKREKSKTSLWERNRRSRINEQFNKLWEALPVYDASKPLSKPEILIQATAAIRELDERLRNLLGPEGGRNCEQKLKVSGDLIKKLEDRIRKLLLRNEQLTNLVRTAGVKIPSECVKRFKKAPKYANALSKEQQAKAIQKELEKENKAKGSKLKKPKLKGRAKKKQLNCVLVVSQPALPNSSCLILSRAANKASKPGAKVNASPQLRLLGTVMPVPPLFTHPVPTQLIIVSSKSPASLVPSASSINCLPVLRPKTTQVNKVPIPALASKYHRYRRVRSPKRSSDEAPAKEDKTKRPKMAPEAKKASAAAPDKGPAKAQSPPSTEAGEAQSKEAPEAPPVSVPDKPAKSALDLEMTLPQTELSNDIFASFQVPPGCQNPESTSPTAAFLLAFPLVSSGAKAAEALCEEATDSQAGTPNLLQIGTMDMGKPAPPFPDSLTPNLFDGFAFFNNKDSSSSAGVYSANCALQAKAKGDKEAPKAGYPGFDSDGFLSGYPNYKSCSNVGTSQQFWEGDGPLFGDSCAGFGGSCKQAKSQKPINWMTTPTTAASYKPDYFLPPFSKEAKPPRLLNSNEQEFRKPPYQEQESQFAWAAPKVPQFLEGPSFVSSTLPTLMGDLALNNVPQPLKGQGRRRTGTCEGGVASFLSVSQLVEPEGGAPRRRNSAKAKSKRRPEPPKDHAKSAVRSSYSAEALIGAEPSTQRPNGKSLVPSFLNDNMAYFPPVQDNSYMGSNQGYQGAFHQNNSFDAYIPPPNNYMGAQEALGEPGGLFPKEKSHCKKSKKRPPNDNVLPSFDMHFFSMPGAVNSPILPDDFHTTYLPPTTLYSCKTPLYSKAGSDSFMPPLGGRPALQPQMSPSVNPGGTSLTNFNLSTIFPEINKGQETFTDTRKSFASLHSGTFIG